MSSPEIKELTAKRYIEMLQAIRVDIQDTLSNYERNDDIEDWDSVAACTNAIMQVDMSIRGAVEWLEVNSGIKEPPKPEHHPMFGFPDVTPDGHDGDHDDTAHGSYL